MIWRADNYPINILSTCNVREFRVNTHVFLGFSLRIIPLYDNKLIIILNYSAQWDGNSALVVNIYSSDLIEDEVSQEI